MPTPDEALKLAQAAVDGPMSDYAPEGWTKVAQSAVDAAKLANDGDYYGAAYKSLQTAEMVVANAGGPAWLTEGIQDAEKLMEMAPDILRQLDQAMQFANEVIAAFPDDPISFVGDALGGMAAQLQAALLAEGMAMLENELGALASSFGAPGVAALLDAIQAGAVGDMIANYVLPGDLAGLAGEHLGDLAVVLPQGLSMLAEMAPPVVDNVAAQLAEALGTFEKLPLAVYASAMSAMTPVPIIPGAGRPAARLTDMHVCPMVTGIVPHVGGPIVSPGAPTVLIGGIPAARVSDMAVCVGPPDAILLGSFTVIVLGQPQARIADPTVHGGMIVTGLPTVLVGG